MSHPEPVEGWLLRSLCQEPRALIPSRSKREIKLATKLQSVFRATTKAASDGVNKAPYSTVILLITDLRDFVRKARRTSEVFQATSVAEQWSLPGGL